MRHAWPLGAIAILAGATALAQAPASGTPLRVIAFGAHPDDCDQKAGGTAAKWAAQGHQVKFVSVTNGDAGHQTEGGGALAKRRRAEAAEAARRFGIVEYDTLDNHDGQPVTPVLADGHLVGVPVPAGTHQVEVSWSRGPLLAGIGLSLAGVTAAIALRKGRAG